ncbi:hypothetical protein TSUD_348870 [Trifolium subterraneum]|uniref:Uncharacterized protein n=1 Tax=Trifolium subterraneum TaxID=3900 RepID=A0A2Z6NVG5_TRISU|nr:hypothetical protein TSUD_348870 [Trifolium subterraneum]
MEKERAEQNVDYEDESLIESQPLRQSLWDSKVPDNFKSPHLPTFDGKTDPVEHLMAVGTQTAIIGAPQHLRCKLLSGTLKDAALRWYMNLPNNSIESYADFHKKFMFSGTKHVKVTATSLFTIRQNYAETLREYLARFSEATITVSNPNQEMVVAAFHNGLKAGHFNESLAQKPATSMQEGIKRASCYIKGPNSQSQQNWQNNDTHKQGYRANRYHPPNIGGGMGYHHYRRHPADREYTPLNRARVHVLHEILQAGLAPLPPPRMHNTVMGPDTEAWCVDHRCKGHDTERCFRLRDLIEELIRSGHLRKFLEDATKGQIALPKQMPNQQKGEGDGRNKGEKQRVAVNTISGGFAGGGESNSARKRYIRKSKFEICSVGKSIFPHTPEISFNPEDARDVIPHDDDPLVIQAQILNCDVKRVLIDSRSSVDILYWDAYKAMRLSDEQLNPYSDTLVGFAGEQVDVMGHITLYTNGINMVNVSDGPKRGIPGQNEWEKIITILRNNRDLFAWQSSDMSEIDESVITLKLSILSANKPVVQRKRKVGEERRTTTTEEVAKLKEAGFIEEIKYPAWLANVVMVKKACGKWKMCVVFKDLNKACPKDLYPLPNIDRLIDGASGYKTLSFMDAYSSYNQIKMHPMDVQHTTFMSNTAQHTAFMSNTCNYFYNVMPFGLKNAGATYQRLMDRVFVEQIGKNLEVYIDDMGVKTQKEGEHDEDLDDIMKLVRKYNMRLNPAKCSFGVQAGKFLGFLLTHRGIEANPDKCQAIINMRSPTSVKEVQQLTGRIVALSKFLSCSGEKACHFFATLRKSERFTWSPECEEAFKKLKYLRRRSTRRWCKRSEEKKSPFTSIFKPSSDSEDGLPHQECVAQTRPDRKDGGLAEYEALIAGMKLAKEMEVQELKVQSHSQLVANQVSGEFQTKDPQLAKYLKKVKGMAKQFTMFELTYVPREQNARADLLAKLASTKKPRMVVEEEDWRSPIIRYLQMDALSLARDEAAKIKKMAAWYTMVGGKLYKRAFTAPMLLCVSNTKACRILKELHEGSCGSHIGSRSLAKKVMRAGFYWPNLHDDAQRHVRTCDKCQRYSNLHHASGEPLKFGLPKYIVSDNGTQFTSERVVEYCRGKGIRNTFISVEHPQANGQAESTNKVILRALKRRISSKQESWVEHLPAILWSYHTTPQSSTGEPPFTMVYGADVMIPVEIQSSTWRRDTLTLQENNAALEESLDLLPELREKAHFREFYTKQRAARKYNTRVIPRKFKEGDLVLKRPMGTDKGGKMAANWEGPFRIQEAFEGGTYKLETMEGETLPRTWNIANMRFYYS